MVKAKLPLIKKSFNLSTLCILWVGELGYALPSLNDKESKYNNPVELF